jgi:hypothetical protein
VPERLGKQLGRDVDLLAGAVKGHKEAAARAAALRVAQDDLDLRLRHQGVARTDLDRLALWARQLQADAAAGDAGSVTGDATTLGLTRERLRNSIDASAATELDSQLRKLQAVADNKDVAAAAKAVPALLQRIQAVRPT